MATEHECRVCGKLSSDCTSIVDSKPANKGSALPLIEKITKVLPALLIYENDPLSKHVCTKCKRSIEEFYEFTLLATSISSKSMEALKHMNHAEYGSFLELVQLRERKALAFYEELAQMVGTTKNLPNGISSDNHEQCSKVFNVNVSNGFNDLEKSSEDLPQSQQMVVENGQSLKNDAQTSKNGEIGVEIDREKSNDVTKRSFTPESLFKLTLQRINENILQLSPKITPKIKPKNRHISIKRESSECENKKPTTTIHANVDPTKLRPLTLERKHALEQNVIILREILDPDLSIERIRFENIDAFDAKIHVRLVDDNVQIHIDEPEWKCKKCRVMFDSCRDLAAHEYKHLKVALGKRIESNYWRDKNSESRFLRNRWLDKIMNMRITHERSPSPINNALDSEVETIEGDVSRLHDQLLVEEQEESAKKLNAKKSSDVKCLAGENYPKGRTPSQCGSMYPMLMNLPCAERVKFYPPEGETKKRYCPICGYEFRQMKSVESHLRRKTCIYQCRFCGEYMYKLNTPPVLQHFDAHYANGECTLVQCDEAKEEFSATALRLKRFLVIKKDTSLETTLNEPKKSSSRNSSASDVAKKSPEQTLIRVRSSHELRSKPKPSAVIRFDNQLTEQYFHCAKCMLILTDVDALNAHYLSCVESDNEEYESNVPSKKRSMNDSPGDVATKRRKLTTKSATDAGNTVPKLTIRSLNHTMISSLDTRASIVAAQPSTLLKNALEQTKQPGIDPLKLTKNKTGTFIKSFKCTQCSQYFPDKNTMIIHKQACVGVTKNNKTEQSPTVKVTKTLTPKPTKSKASDAPKRISTVKPIKSESSPDVTGIKRSAPTSTKAKQTIAKPQTYKCRNCFKEFATPTTFSEHAETCSTFKTKSYECPFCQLVFTTEQQYTTHILYNHPDY